MLGDRTPTMADMKALRFSTRVINESMRLYPQPPVLLRRSLEDVTLGGYQVNPRNTAKSFDWLFVPGPE